MEQIQSQQTEQQPHVKETLNNRPVIAILAQINQQDKTGQSYIAASYVKYLEASGARVVPVPVGVSDDQLDEIFQGVNGVIFPGGGVKWDVSKPGYYKHAVRFVKLARQANDKGDYFPVWGTCLGFQTLHVIQAGEKPEVLSKGFASEDITIPLKFKDDPKKSRLFKEMSDDLLKTLGEQPVTYNHHQAGITPETYQKEAALNDFFDVISTNEDLEGRAFVSTVEGKKYPFYGTQWHPEKNNLEFKSNLHINHTPNAVCISQYMSNFFVNEARKNKHQFSSEEKLLDLLIYNYSPIYTGKGDDEYKNFAQIYKFDPIS